MHMITAAYIFAALIVLSNTVLDVCEGDPESHKLNKIAETLKMLQSLDKYYGQVARPRSPRSSSHYGLHLLSRKDEASLKMRLRDLDNQYLHRSRPRFGKRGGYMELVERLNNAMNEEMAEDQVVWEGLQ